jgi:hypothetical protein
LVDSKDLKAEVISDLQTAGYKIRDKSTIECAVDRVGNNDKEISKLISAPVTASASLRRYQRSFGFYPKYREDSPVVACCEKVIRISVRSREEELKGVLYEVSARVFQFVRILPVGSRSTLNWVSNVTILAFFTVVRLARMKARPPNTIR